MPSKTVFQRGTEAIILLCAENDIRAEKVRVPLKYRPKRCVNLPLRTVLSFENSEKRKFVLFFVVTVPNMGHICCYNGIAKAKKQNKKEIIKMKQMVEMAKKSVYDRDGFINGFLRGAAGSAAVLAVLSIISECIG